MFCCLIGTITVHCHLDVDSLCKGCGARLDPSRDGDIHKFKLRVYPMARHGMALDLPLSIIYVVKYSVPDCEFSKIFHS